MILASEPAGAPLMLMGILVTLLALLIHRERGKGPND